MPERLREAITSIDDSVRDAAHRFGAQSTSVGIVYDQELVWGKGYGLIDSSDPSSYVVLHV
jgi:CubicO group peptidase (beta-lactamase class C family)